ncbi:MULTISPECIES: C40 family peptidase [Pseudomonas]|uniref:Peptidoglycan endopeptidase n=1 Tax=Pseudomonas fluorescens TaxID=294 RepID=A0A7Z6QS95_PSEFL|nr:MULTISPECIES: C40 family peptidase [Pseudomonas]OCW27320.1 peptidase P60 [Pseudomonas sp. S3E12]QDG57471.1 NlpC/P60 family protein [Pseudomonas sp. NIBRBAC000502773]RDS93003.1 peptidoglycan endopeptidase [Pseudomonas fluorescens]HAA39834.1 peptidoglycan endopeptidase [Pseudomonas sp.]
MRPFLKTWLTICLLMPLAAHATNREQRLPNVNGFTPKVHSAPSTAKSAKPTVSRPTQLSKAHGKAVPGLMAVNTKQSSTVLSRAVNVLGTPYRWGGSSPSKGFDCSGLVKYAFNDVAAVDLPRTSNAMAAGHGQKVERKDLKPGDLLFFKLKSRQVNHVAIYLGNDRFIHAPRRGKSVSIDTLKKPFWDKNYVIAKRVLPKEQNTLRVVQR